MTPYVGSMLTATNVLESMVGITDRKQRGVHVLRALCEARGAGAGHLYLCEASGLAFAGSLGDEAPPEGLSAFLEGHLRFEREQSDNATVVVTAAQLETMLPASWSDAAGRVHRPFVLTCMVGGEPQHVGIASFVGEDAVRRTALDAQLNAALASCLVERASSTGSD